MHTTLNIFDGRKNTGPVSAVVETTVLNQRPNIGWRLRRLKQIGKLEDVDTDYSWRGECAGELACPKCAFHAAPYSQGMRFFCYLFSSLLNDR
jgi:hypothetical protein